MDVLGKVTSEVWKNCVGQVVDGVYPLSQFLGSSANAAVFLTDAGGRKAAIKLIPADPKTAEAQIARWQGAAKLSHPHLVRLLKSGRTQVAGSGAIYVVMEYMEEDLSQVLPERSLTTEETRQMLEPVLSALAYLHAQGWVHGHLKASNIMAGGDQVKLSSDGVLRAGETKTADPAEDVWALGLSLIEVLTQKREAVVPATLPEPFRDIAKHCLEPDPAKRWTVPQVAARLQGNTTSKLRYLIPAAVVVAIPLVWFALKSSSDSTTVSQVKPTPAVAAAPATADTKPQSPPPVQKPEKAAVKPTPEPQEKPPAEPPAVAEPVSSDAVPDGVVNEVLPDIPAKARNTIHNKATVSVRVRVDPAGNVLDAKTESSAASKFFSERATRAARKWKFKPSDSDQEWSLRFEVYKTETKVFASRLNR